MSELDAAIPSSAVQPHVDGATTWSVPSPSVKTDTRRASAAVTFTRTVRGGATQRLGVPELVGHLVTGRLATTSGPRTDHGWAGTTGDADGTSRSATTTALATKRRAIVT